MASDPENRILLQDHVLPGALVAVGDFFDHTNHHRVYENLAT